MARIEWQPLAIPDIGDSALRAQQASANSIRGAFQDLGGVLNQWKGQRRDEVLADITRRQLSFSDPEAFQAAVADGSINLESDYLTPEDMMRVSGYQDTLAQRRNAQTAYEQGNVRFANDQTIFGRGTETYNRENRERIAFNEAFPDVLPLFEEARLTGRSDAILPGLREIGVRHGLTGEQFNEFMTKSFSYAQEGRAVESHDLSQRSGESRLNQDNITFRQTQDDRTDTRNVQTLLAATQQLAGANFDDKSPGGGAEMALSMAAESGQYTARQIAAAAQQLGVSAPASVLAQLRSEGLNTTPSFGESGGSGAVGDRNNNPGNVRDVGQFVGQPGYLGTDSRGFARFSSPEAGANVAANQLRLYMNGRSRNVPRGGIRTINEIVRTWAPVGSENSAESVANYQAYVARRLGVGVNDQLTEADIPRLAAAMGEFENGRTVQSRFGGTLSLNASDLERSGNRANAEGVLPQIDPADPTSFIPAFESRMLNAIQGLSGQGGSAGLQPAAQYNQTQSIRRDVGVAAAAALQPASRTTPAGVLAGTRIDQRRLEDAATQLMREVPGLTSDTAISVLAGSNARVSGPNYGNQIVGNVRALGGGVRVDMVRATQIARSLQGQGGALLAESAANITRGQAEAARINTQMTDALARYRAGVTADARVYGEGNVSPMTRAYGERLIALQTQLENISKTSESAVRAYRGQPAPARRSTNGTTAAPSQRVAPIVAASPQRQIDARTARTRAINNLAPALGPLSGLINLIADQQERTRR